MLGIIRVFTAEDEAIVNEHGRIMNEVFGLETVSRVIPNQPNGIYNDETELDAVPKIVELAKEMVSTYRLEAITISCAADPALKETREALDIPVLTAGECGAFASLMVGSRVGVIGISEEAPEPMVRALGGAFHSYLSSPNLRKTTDLFSAEAKDELLSLSQQIISDGADVILFACTGFSTIGLKVFLLEHLNVPIIDLVEAQAIAYQLIKKES